MLPLTKKNLKDEFELLFKFAGIGMAVVSPDGKWLQVNKALTKIVGYSEEELLKMDFQSITHPEDLDVDLKHVKEILSGKIDSYSMEKRYIKKDGSIVWIQLTVALAKHNNQSPKYFISQIQDINDRKLAEKKLKEKDQQLSLVLETIFDGFWEWHIENDSTYMSPRFWKILGINSKEKNHNPNDWRELIDKDDYLKVMRNIEKHISSKGQYAFSQEIKYRKKDNSTIWVLCRGRVVEWSADEKPVRMIGTNTDITELKLTQNRLEAAKQKAEKEAQAKSVFLANMSHEIRTPLNGMFGYLNLLEETNLSNHQQECVDTIQSCSKTLLTVINDVLDISKLESDKPSLEYSSVDLVKVVKTSCQYYQPTAEKQGVTLNFKSNLNFPKILYCDEIRIRQIANNLISNAIKFSPKGTVDVSLESVIKSNSYYHVLLTITDTGIGIDLNLQKNLFEPFVQADPSTTRKYGGTGLGLTICKSLVSLMGGDISVESTLGKGSQFTISLELREVTNPERTKKTEVIVNNQVDFDKKILVVEDNEINRSLIVTLLKKYGVKDIRVALNGLEAVQQTRENHFDIILMDCQMPEMDGYEATRIIKGEQGDLSPQIIAVTASSFKSDLDRCLSSGMDDYISKPFSSNDLFCKLFGQRIPTKKKSNKITLHFIDQEIFEGNFGHDREALSMISDRFKIRSNKLFKSMEIAAKSNNTEKVSYIAHSLKGSAGYFSCHKLNELLQMIEADADSSDFTFNQNLFDEVHTLIQGVIIDLNKFLANSAHH